MPQKKLDIFAEVRCIHVFKDFKIHERLLSSLRYFAGNYGNSFFYLARLKSLFRSNWALRRLVVGFNPEPLDNYSLV